MELPLAARTTELRELYLALMERPGLREKALEHLADPTSPDFAMALESADGLGLKPFALVFAHLNASGAEAFNAWRYAAKWAALGDVDAVIALADRRYPLDDDSWNARYVRSVVDPLR